MNNIQKIEIIDDICNNYIAPNSHFDVRKCLTYLDEFEQNFNSSKRAVCLVSITFLKNEYINFTEKRWLEDIRNKYGFKKGYPIHFTTLRDICREVSYPLNGSIVTTQGWNDDYVLFKASKLFNYETKQFQDKIPASTQKKFIDSYHIWKLFRKLNEYNHYVLDIEKLQNFYDDIYNIIRDSNFNILCTGILYDLSSQTRGIFNKNQLKNPYINAFTHHLDLLCFYLNHGFYSADEKNSLGDLYKHHFSSKLRWDGDDGFNMKSDYRSVFNQCMVQGTPLYQPEIVRGCLEEIRFINKAEIGYYDDLTNQRLVSHIGCDLADFIAYYIGKHSLKTHIINDLTENGMSTSEAENKYQNSISFKLGDRIFSPYNDILHEKILSSDSASSIQLIPECAYLK